MKLHNLLSKFHAGVATTDWRKGGTPRGSALKIMLANLAHSLEPWGRADAGQRIDVLSLAEHLGVAVIEEPSFFHEDKALGHLSTGTSGYIIRTRDPVTSSRGRFTIAHELAHRAFYPVSPVLTPGCGRLSPRTPARHPQEKIEWLCEDFARALLLPPRDLLAIRDPRLPDVLRLARHYGVSAEVLVRRLAYDLGNVQYCVYVRVQRKAPDACANRQFVGHMVSRGKDYENFRREVLSRFGKGKEWTKCTQDLLERFDGILGAESSVGADWIWIRAASPLLPAKGSSRRRSKVRELGVLANMKQARLFENTGAQGDTRR